MTTTVWIVKGWVQHEGHEVLAVFDNHRAAWAYKEAREFSSTADYYDEYIVAPTTVYQNYQEAP